MRSSPSLRWLRESGPRALTFFIDVLTMASFQYDSPRVLVKHVTHRLDRDDFECYRECY